MAVRLRLKRMGRSHRAFYRLHVVDSRSPRDGGVIEQLGHYDPIEKDAEKQIVINVERATYWMDQGAQPSETVSSLLKRKGVTHRMIKIRAHVTPKPAAAPAAAAEGEKKAE